MSRNLAIVIADTSQHVLARNALLHSARGLDPRQVLIYSDRPEAWPEWTVQRIDPIADLAAYNRLVVQQLAEDLRADHALVIQYDGFVLDAREFSPLFLHYDYIGAPWPHFQDMDVGNGGFSLRSRRLVERVASKPYDGRVMAEDLFICRELRPELEQCHHLRFAPRQVAAHFSMESVPVPWPTLGFHGVFHLPMVYRERIDYLLEHLSLHTLRRWERMLRPAFARISPAAVEAFERRLAPEPQPQAVCTAQH